MIPAAPNELRAALRLIDVAFSLDEAGTPPGLRRAILAARELLPDETKAPEVPEELVLLQWVARCAKVPAPYGISCYAINDAVMARIRAVVADAGLGPETRALWSSSPKGRD